MADYIEREEVKKEIIEWASIEKNLIEEIKKESLILFIMVVNLSMKKMH